MSQALTHRSWTYENQAVVAEANQRDYGGALATEGSEVLTTLVRHHYALQTLSASSRLATTVATHPAVSREVVLALFEAMPVEAGGCSVRRECRSSVPRSKRMPRRPLPVPRGARTATCSWSVNH